MLSTLQRELEVVDSFFHLMQVRFGDRIQLERSLEPGCLDKKVPTLALQLLVENAIKHNVATDQAPVRICITATARGVEVANTITRPPQGVRSGQVGLRNLRERYQHLSRYQPEVLQQPDRFQVRLPYITAIRKEAYV
ncbi:putative sensor-like histidine kinase YehU [Cesiribacter andamanensis AMV16]|uniref:Putative sensor-like histidine kinase YehU n=1 Tax=Cesiribacter andamanensis AMV16 TaxID=1279009 RepID=M7MZI5_9BACT|nr:putative sensor-like histidine kinase YehU [Cesiribacter andamanensis AMV16]